MSHYQYIRANDALKSGLPLALRDPNQMLITDDTTKKWHLLLLKNLGILEPSLF